jgi:hypothetical protein
VGGSRGALRIKLVELNRFGETVAVFYGDCKRERQGVESCRRWSGKGRGSPGAIGALEGVAAPCMRTRERVGRTG